MRNNPKTAADYSSTGIEIWRGPSMFDPSVEIVVILTVKTSNRKTGDMAQIWILRADCTPIDALTARSERGWLFGDFAICGNCKHRRGSCYVNVAQAPQQIIRTWRAGRYMQCHDNGRPDYDEIEQFLHTYFDADPIAIRFGAYGDPAAVPLKIWNPIVDMAERITGYTHAWRAPHVAADFGWRFLMASADSESDAHAATRQGWRYFRAKGAHERRIDLEAGCPAATENGARVDCNACHLCDGRRPKKSIVIDSHGRVAELQAAREVRLMGERGAVMALPMF